MKKLITAVLILCALFACAHAEEAPIWQPLLDQWNAQTGEELKVNICQYWKDHATDYPSRFAPKYWPCQIRIGGTTEALLADKKGWDMAIVSSKEVDLNALIADKLVHGEPYAPDLDSALREWLLPENIRRMLPCRSDFVYFISVYDYHADTGEALLLIEQDTRWRKKSNYVNTARDFIDTMMHTRPAEQTRKIDGINVVYDWPAADLLSRASEWDMALLENFPEKDLTALEQAFLLTDLSSSDYFATRDTVSTHPANRDRWNNAIYGQGGSLVASRYAMNGGNSYILIINPFGVQPDKAMAFAEHLVKSYEWYFHAEAVRNYKDAYGYTDASSCHIAREDVDW